MKEEEKKPGADDDAASDDVGFIIHYSIVTATKLNPKTWGITHRGEMARLINQEIAGRE